MPDRVDEDQLVGSDHTDEESLSETDLEVAAGAGEPSDGSGGSLTGLGGH